MTKKQAKIEALRIATALINAGVDFSGSGLKDEEIEAVMAALESVANLLYKKAVALGGDFNPYTGYNDEKK